MARHIVAAVDGSPQSPAAARWAAEEARRRGLPLRLVHGWEWRPCPAASVPMDTSQQAWAVRTLRRAPGSRARSASAPPTPKRPSPNTSSGPTRSWAPSPRRPRTRS
ncbi:universal stress protein [Streptomyces sp. NPDC003877]